MQPTWFVSQYLWTTHNFCSAVLQCTWKHEHTLQKYCSLCVQAGQNKRRKNSKLYRKANFQSCCNDCMLIHGALGHLFWTCETLMARLYSGFGTSDPCVPALSAVPNPFGGSATAISIDCRTSRAQHVPRAQTLRHTTPFNVFLLLRPDTKPTSSSYECCVKTHGRTEYLFSTTRRRPSQMHSQNLSSSHQGSENMNWLPIDWQIFTKTVYW